MPKNLLSGFARTLPLLLLAWIVASAPAYAGVPSPAPFAWPTMHHAPPSSRSAGAARPAPRPLFVAGLHADTASFVDIHAGMTGVIAGSSTWYDIDNDGDLDILSTGWDDSEYVAKIYVNDSGIFVDAHANLPGLGTDEHGVAWGDYDNDGDVDIVMTGRTDVHADSIVSRIYRNDGGIFHDIGADLVPSNGACVSWCDYDGDGSLDLLITGSADAGSTFDTRLYHNDGGVFTAVPMGLPGVWASTTSWGDYDNDGDPDLFMTGYGSMGLGTWLFRNDGGTLVDTHTSFLAAAVGTSAWVDFDNDGDLDISYNGLSSGGPIVKLYRNDGGGVFVDVPVPFKPMGVSSLAWGDFDNDGDMDFAEAGSQDLSLGLDPTTKIYRNDSGTFVDMDADIPQTWYGSVEWGDYDNDGRLDLLVAGGTVGRPDMAYEGPYYSVSAIMRNMLAPQNSAPSVPAHAVTAVSAQDVQLAWDRSSDGETLQKALTYNIRVGTTPGAGDIVAPVSVVSTGARRVPKNGNAGFTTTRKLANLRPGTYYWSVQSVDNGYAGSPFAPDQTFEYPLVDGQWHLLSLPGHFTDSSRLGLFPAARSLAYAFRQNHYAPEEELRTGAGYWLKFPASTPPDFTSADPITSLTIEVAAGWNLIGAVGTQVPSPVDANILTDFFGYDNGYIPSATLEPGKGYWVKLSQMSDLTLGTPPTPKAASARERILDGMRRLTVEDAQGKRQRLYVGVQETDRERSRLSFELPPPPPLGAFDARFASGSYAEFVRPGESATIPLSISSARYPITLRWSGREDASLQSAVTVNGVALLPGASTVDGPSSLAVTLAGRASDPAGPEEFSLSQNYPNPFNPTTMIRFSVPSAGWTTLKVYNILGEEVAILLSAQRSPGKYAVPFDGSALPDGVYLCRLTSGAASSARKMLLLK